MDTVKAIVAITVIMLGLPVGILLSIDWLKRRRSYRDARAANQIILPNPYRIQFTISAKDRVDAHSVVTSLAGGLGFGLRTFLICLGVLWASGPIWALVLGSARINLKSFVMWLSGCAVVWGYLLRPMVERIRLKRGHSADRDVAIEFGDHGVTISEPPNDIVIRPWSEVEGALAAKQGLLLCYDDGVTNWLPRRAFSTPGELMALSELVARHLAAKAG